MQILQKQPTPAGLVWMVSGRTPVAMTVDQGHLTMDNDNELWSIMWLVSGFTTGERMVVYWYVNDCSMTRYDSSTCVGGAEAG